MQTLPDGQYEAALLPDGTAAVLDEKTGRALRYDASLSRCLRQEAGWGSPVASGRHGISLVPWPLRAGV